LSATPLACHTDLMALFARHGFDAGDVPILQPAEPFVELSGEDIRRRLFLVSEAGAEEMCLRPEFTIPAARAWLSASCAGQRAQAFIGPVFRQRADGSGEFIQAGLESFGRTDIEAADAELLALAIEAEALLGPARRTIRMGDVGLLAALTGAMNLPAAVVRRIRRNGGAGVSAAEPARTSGLSAYTGVLNALKGADPDEARAFVKDLLSIAGLKAVGGRTPAEIAERFLIRAEDDGAGLAAEQAALLARFRAISGDPDAVSAEVRALSADAGIDLDAALDRFDARTGFMAARGIDLSRLSASAAFARNLDYYTGFVFEFVAADAARPAIAGGRYDGLLRRLGAPADVPAIGCAIWLERFGDPA